MYNKYRNKKTKVDGILFDSKREAARYMELKMLEKAGVIQSLKLQPSFDLLPKTLWESKTLRKIVYRADFSYTMDNIHIVEDVKGVKTAVYKLKRHMFLLKYPQYKFIET